MLSLLPACFACLADDCSPSGPSSKLAFSKKCRSTTTSRRLSWCRPGVHSVPDAAAETAPVLSDEELLQQIARSRFGTSLFEQHSDVQPLYTAGGDSICLVMVNCSLTARKTSLVGEKCIVYESFGIFDRAGYSVSVNSGRVD